MNGRLTRVTCTIPADLVRRADALARQHARSRSWVLSEATRRYLARPSDAPETLGADAAFESARDARRRADLALTAEQRVAEAEQLADTGAAQRPRLRQVALFDSFEDYFAWKRRQA